MTSEQIPGIPAAGGPQSVLVYTSMQAQSKVYDKYVSRTSIRTGIGQIVIGVLCIVFNIVDLAVLGRSDGGIGFVGHGIWCGVMFIVTGCFGIAAAKHRTKCQIIPYLVLCTISACATIGLLGVGILGVITGGQYVDYIMRCTKRGYQYEYPYYYSPCKHEDGYPVALAMEILLCVFGFVEAILAIKGATNGCRSGICCVGCEGCCCVSDPPTDISADYSSNNGQLIYINPTQAVQYVSLPQTVMSGSGAPPPSNVPSYTQFGWSAPPPPQPPSTGVPSAQAEPPPEYAAEYPGNSKTADDKLPLWP